MRQARLYQSGRTIHVLAPDPDRTTEPARPTDPGHSASALPPIAAFDPGRPLAGRYRIERFVAEGGMGEVHEAWDLELQEPVAVKVLRPRLAADRAALERLRREVQLARRVSHPGIARLHDLAEEPALQRGRPPVAFVVMELLPGENLAQRVRREGRLDAATALALARQMAAALDAAHAAGVVHRDFKSANVMLCPGAPGAPPRAVITDFGVAVAAGEAGDERRTASLVGTPEYMAPEQVEGGVATARSDVYAFGVVLFEMVTGRLPFEAPTALAAALRRLHQPAPSPRTIDPALDPRLERVILRCLERDPARRYPNAGAAIADLDATPRHPEWRAFAAVGALALSVAVAFVALRSPRPEPAVAVPPLAPAATASGRALGEGLARLRELDLAAATTALERAIREQPQQALAHAALAETRRRRGDREGALEAARRALALATPLPAEPRLRATGYARGALGEWPAAVEAWSALHRFVPDDPDAGLALGDALVAAARAARARELVAELRNAGRVSPGRLDLLEAEAVATADPSLARQRVAAAKEWARANGAAGIATAAEALERRLPR
jgi:tetratricopeptide (TPR) repeat protein